MFSGSSSTTHRFVCCARLGNLRTNCNAVRHPHIAANAGTATNGDTTQDRCPSVNDHIVFHNGVARLALEWIAGCAMLIVTLAAEFYVYSRG